MLPRLIAGMLMLTLMLVQPAFSQESAPNESAKTEPAKLDPFGRSTPKGTVVGFIKAAGDENFQRAAQYLDTREISKQVSERTRQLLVVLNRGLLARDLDQLSEAPEGKLEDDLPPNVERVGVVKSGGSTLELLLERQERRDGLPIWRFSAATLNGVPAMYEKMRPLWIEGHLWPPLREIRYFEVPLWQWLGFPLSLLLVLGLARLLSRGVFAVLRPLLYWLTGERAASQLAQVTAPIQLLALSLAVFVWVAVASLPVLARFTLARTAVALGIVGLAWLVMRLSDVSMQLVEARLKRLNDLGGITVVQLTGRLGKALTVIIAVLALLYVAHVDLTTALAGLGIGGVAIAFAAQKTLENLFGGVMIISDQPVRVGDFCKAGDVLGTVESIGLRSTRIRTVDRTVVSVPNAQLSSENLENFGFRDKILFRPTLALRYETQVDQLRYVLAEIRRMLYEHPMVDHASARVRFVRFGVSSLDLEIFAYVLSGEFPRFLAVQEDLLLRIMDIVEGSGTSLAFPSSTTYLARDAGLDKAKTQDAVATVARWRQERELPFPDFHPSRITEFENRLEYPAPDSAVRQPVPPRA
ncbi:mechanosensitive ion channel family protein [uncultured Piscinibacter sp.]|uniref:mechanosensitive ion channel family protein n=1 Tax=uncultured Piscinibacter sp. TaxID=1131835 RepID=UPI0026124C1D|nr:mechanosensitive ion channel family protein [uncultured Piscinibacter sp.]